MCPRPVNRAGRTGLNHVGPVLGEGIADARRLRNRAACPAPTRLGEFRVVEVHRPIDHGNEDLSQCSRDVPLPVSGPDRGH